MGKEVLMLLADEYRPDPRVMKEARALAEMEYRVTIISWDRSHSHPSVVTREESRVLFIRTGMVDGAGSLLLNFPSYLWKCVRWGLKEQPDVVHAHDLDTLFAGTIIAALKEIPLVYDAHEHYAAMVAQQIPSLASKLLDRFEELLMGRVDLLIAANGKIRDYLLPRTTGNSIIVMNTIDPPSLARAQTCEKEEEITLFYAGSLESGRYIEEIIGGVESRDDTRLLLAGEGPLLPLVKVKSEGMERLQFLGYLPHHEMLKKMASSDVVMALMDPSNENNRIGTPNKMFEAMALGVPVIVSKGTLSGEIVEREGCGIALEWSHENFRRALDKLKNPEVRRGMGENGRAAVESEYNWSSMKERLLTAYSKLLD